MSARCSRMGVRISAGAFALIVALALAGCAAPAENAESQDPGRVYSYKIQAVTSELADHLDSFNEAASANNIYMMRSEADSAFQSIDKITSLTPPDNYSEVQQDYVNGCNDLKDALSSYLDVYSAMANATEEHPFDFKAYEDQLKSIQDKYNSGIEALKAGDQKASSS